MFLTLTNSAGIRGNWVQSWNIEASDDFLRLMIVWKNASGFYTSIGLTKAQEFVLLDIRNLAARGAENKRVPDVMHVKSRFWKRILKFNKVFYF